MEAGLLVQNVNFWVFASLSDIINVICLISVRHQLSYDVLTKISNQSSRNEKRELQFRPLLAHLGDEQGAHARARSSTKGMAQLEALQAVAALGLLSLASLSDVALPQATARRR